MGDVGEDWKGVRREQRAARRAMYAKETALVAAYYPELTVVETFNGGAHWRVRNGYGVVIDLWPSTGKWRVVGTDTVRTGGVCALRERRATDG